MKSRFILFQRGAVFYCEDTTTGKQTSLRTRDESEALALLRARNEASRQPVLNLQMARTYLTASDPAFNARTWQQVMEEIVSIQKGNTQTRWQSAIRDRAFDSLRNRKLVGTAAEHFFAVLKCGTTATNVYPRRINNYALALNWLPWCACPKSFGPK